MPYSKYDGGGIYYIDTIKNADLLFLFFKLRIKYLPCNSNTKIILINMLYFSYATNKTLNNFIIII